MYSDLSGQDHNDYFFIFEKMKQKKKRVGRPMGSSGLETSNELAIYFILKHDFEERVDKWLSRIDEK